jgi:hypothetical protein
VPDERRERDRQKDELEVRDGRRVLDALVVCERVTRDGPGDDESEQHAAGVHRSAHAPNEKHTDANRENADRLPGPEYRARGDGTDQHEHGRDAARDRIDQADVGGTIGRGEKEEVDELEGTRERDPRYRLPLHPPGGGGHRREQRDRDHQRDRRRCSHV